MDGPPNGARIHSQIRQPRRRATRLGSEPQGERKASAMKHTRAPLIVPFSPTAGTRHPDVTVDPGWGRGGLVPDAGWNRPRLVPDAGWRRGGLVPVDGWRIP
jgi:hypothetical protein